MSWKKQGGTNRLDSTSNVNVNSVVANKFTIKDYFYGDMNVLGNINAEGSMKVKGNLLAAYVGAENIFANLTLKVLRNATIYGSMAVKKDMYVYERQILGNIERNGNIVTLFNNDSITGNLGITQAKILDSRTGVAEYYYDGHIGFGTNNPVATLDITGNIPLTFAVRTDDINAYSIISRNNEDGGVVAHTDLATTEIQFYKETPIPSADISGATPDARIQYIEGGVLAVQAADAVITYSKGVYSTRDTDAVVNNSAVTIYDIENGKFAYDAYNADSSNQSNAISIAGLDAASMSMIHFTNSTTNSGISIGGGAYPPNTAQRMGTIGYTQPDGTYAPAINLVSSATNRLFHRTTVGINTPYPRTDEYVMDVNGPTIIRSTTETNVVQNIPFEMDVLKHCRADHNYIIAVGKPYTVAGDPDTFYTDNFGSTVIKNYQQKVYFTRDMGQTWNISDFNDTDIGLLPDNAIHAAFAYDASLCFVCTQRGFLYYSVNGGTNWYGIAGLPFSDNIHSIFLTDYFVGTHSVYRVFVCGNTTCTWFDMPTSYYTAPDNFTIFSTLNGSITFPGVCTIADGLDQIMYITVSNQIYSYDISNYSGPLQSFISNTYTGGDSYVSLSIGSPYVAMFIGPGLITYTTDGGNTYINITAVTEPLLSGGKILNSVFLQDGRNALITGYDSTGALFLYTQDQFQTFNILTVDDLREFGAPPHVLSSANLYDAFLVSPESIMFFDIVESYDAVALHRGKSTIYNLYIPHILTPSGSRSTSNGVAFRVDYGYTQFGDQVTMEKDVHVNGVLSANTATILNTNINSANFTGVATLSGGLDVKSRMDIYNDISANGVLISPQQIGYISNVSQDIQTQLDDKLGKSESATVSGQLAFSGNNTFSGTNTFTGSNQFDNLRVASMGLTTVLSPSVSYTINPTKLSYLRSITSDVQTQLNDKLSLSAGGSVLNGTYTFNGQINIANTVVVADNSILSPADFGAMKGATSNFQAQLDVMKIAMDSISGGSTTAIMEAAMTANVALNTFNVPNRFNKDTTIVGNVIANYATITPTQLSYISAVSSDIQTQLNNRVTFNPTNGIDLSGAITSDTGISTAGNVTGNTVNTQYQTLSGHSDISGTTQTLTAIQSGSIINITDVTTLTLPSPTTAGVWFMLYNSSTSDATITTIDGLFVPTPNTSTITLMPNSTLQIRSNGTNWAVVGGTYDCARLSLPNFSLGDYSTAGSLTAGTNLVVAGSAAIGQPSVRNSAYALDVSGNMFVKGNTIIEGNNYTTGGIDVHSAIVRDYVFVGSSAIVGNSLAIGKSASTGIELDVSGDAVISSSLAVGRSRNPAYVVDISGAAHITALTIDNNASVGGAVTIGGLLSTGSSMSVAGDTTFAANVAVGKTTITSPYALDVSGAMNVNSYITASTLALRGDPVGGFALDMSGNIRAKSLTLTDGVGLPSGGVADSALSTNVALLNRASQTFSGDNYFKYISVGGATKPTGTTTYAIDISGGLRVTSGSVVLPSGSITTNNLPPGVCIKEGNNLYLVDPVTSTTPYLGIGKGAMLTQYNVDVAGSMNADGPIYAQKLGINKKGTITSGTDVDISGTAAISNTLTVGQKLGVGTSSVVVASATINKRSGPYDLYWGTGNSTNLSIQLSSVFSTISLASRQITYTPYTTAGTYTFTYVFDYATAITNHPVINIYPNYVSALSPGTSYTIAIPATDIKTGTFSVTAALANGLTTGTMYVDIGGVGTGTVPSNLVANTQSIIVRLAAVATNTSPTDEVPICMNSSSIANGPARFAGGIYADTAQTVHFGSNAPIMSGSNILPGTIPSTAFATSGVDLGSDQTVVGAKTFANNLTVASPYGLLVGTSAVEPTRNTAIKLDVSGGIQTSQFMGVGKTTILNMVSKRPDNVGFTITNTDIFGVQTSAQSVRTYSINPLFASLIDISTVTMPKAFSVSGYYTFTMSYTPVVPTDRFASSVVLSSIPDGTVLATLNLSSGTSASSTIYLSSGIQNVRIVAPSIVSGLTVSQIGLNIDYRYDNTATGFDYELAVNGDQAVFGKFTPYFGIDASSTQTINFGTNAPTMSGAGIATSSILDTALSANIARLNATQYYTAKPKFTVGADVSGTLTADKYIGDGSDISGVAKLAATNTFAANQTMSGTLTVAGQTILNGNLTGTTDGLKIGSDVRILDTTFYLRTNPDVYHGIRYQSGTVDGPKIFGYGGGALSVSNPSAAADILQWTKDNIVAYRPILRDTYILDMNGSLNNIRISKSNLSSITGSNNIGIGVGVLAATTTGSGNLAIGSNALSTGAATNMNNVAIGMGALTTCTGNTNVAVGYNAASGGMAGSNNTFIGTNTRVDTSANTYTNSTAIGANAVINASNQLVLGTAGQTVSVPGSMTVTGTLNAAIPANNISNAATGTSLNIATTPITCQTVSTNGALTVNNGNLIINAGSVNNGLYIYPTTNGTYPYLSVVNSNVAMVTSGSSASWQITSVGDAFFNSITTKVAPTFSSGINTTTVNATGATTLSTLSVSGTTTFTGLTTHNGGITATNVNANTLAVSTTSTFGGAATFGGLATFSTTATSNTQLLRVNRTGTTGFIFANNFGFLGYNDGNYDKWLLDATGKLTLYGGLDMSSPLNTSITFGTNKPVMDGTYITNIPDGALRNSSNYVKNNVSNTMTLSSGNYFQFNSSTVSGTSMIIDSAANIGTSSSTWSIPVTGAASFTSVTVAGSITANNAGTTLNVATNIKGQLYINSIAASTATPLSIVYDSQLSNMMLGTSNMSYNNPSVITGIQNIGLGPSALNANKTGSHNIAIGDSSLARDPIGSNCIAIGWAAAYNQSGGNFNTVVGTIAGRNLTTGTYNTMIGAYSMAGSTNSDTPTVTGSNNTAIGNYAGFSHAGGSNNTYLGSNTDSTGGLWSNSTAVGYNAKITASYQIVLGTVTEIVDIPGALSLSVRSTDITTNETLTKPLYNIYRVNPPNTTAFTITLPTITADMIGVIMEFKRITGQISTVINVAPASGQYIQSGYVAGTATVNGTTPTPLLNAYMVYSRIVAISTDTWAILSDSDSMVNLTNAQTISGAKTFSSPPVMSGASILSNTIPAAAISGGVMDLTTAQTVAGVKTFTSNVIAPRFTVPSTTSTIILTNSDNNPGLSSWNTVIGNNAGASLTGAGCTFIGNSAGFSYSSSNNTCVGANSGTTGGAGVNTLTGTLNTHLGMSSGNNVRGNSSNNTFLGTSADFATATTYNNSTAVGYNAKITASYQIVLGTSGETVSIPGKATISGTMTVGVINISNAANNYSIGSNFMNTSIGYDNIGIGYYTLAASSGGSNNIGIGSYALSNKTSGASNVAVGSNAGKIFTTGSNNTAIGYSSAYTANTPAGTGSNNTSIGYNSANNINNSSANNTFLGAYTDISGGPFNNSTAIGYSARITGNNQIVLGTASETVNVPGSATISGTLTAGVINISNTGYNYSIGTNMNTNIGTDNIGIGNNALTANATGGSANIAVGSSALGAKTTGNNNVAVGYSAGKLFTTGSNNTSVGYSSAYNGAAAGTGNNNTSIGYYSANNISNSSANNTFLGAYTDISGGPFNNSTAVGYNAKITASNQIMLGTSNEGVNIPGAAYIGAGGCTVTSSGNAYFKVSSTGYSTGTSGFFMYMDPAGKFYVLNTATTQTGVQLASYTATSWSAVSDARDKKDVQTIHDGLECIAKLRPVKFKYTSDDDTIPIRLGFIAQEVKEVIPNVVNGSEEDRYVLSMTEMIPHMVNAIQQLNDENAKQKTEIAELRSELAELRSLVQSLINKEL